jgi:hypothetical protein
VTNELIALIDRLDSEHVEVGHALDTLGSAMDRTMTWLCGLRSGRDRRPRSRPGRAHQSQDEVLFPGIAEMIGEPMVNLFMVEQVRIIALPDQAYERMGQAVADFDGCAELRELLGNHTEREDQVLFPTARGCWPTGAAILVTLCAAPRGRSPRPRLRRHASSGAPFRARAHAATIPGTRESPVS